MSAPGGSTRLPLRERDRAVRYGWFATDLVLVLCAAYAAAWVRFDLDISDSASVEIAMFALLAVGLYAVIGFVLGYISIAWLLKFVSNHSFAWFAAYRIPLGLLVMALLGTGVMAA